MSLAAAIAHRQRQSLTITSRFPREKRLDAVGARRAGRCGTDQKDPPDGGSRRTDLHRAARLVCRNGAKRVRQVKVQGLFAGAFNHRDSRAGDPDCTQRGRRTRCKPSTGAGSASTAEFFSRRPWPHRGL
jgi:hypothetical protein